MRIWNEVGRLGEGEAGEVELGRGIEVLVLSVTIGNDLVLAAASSVQSLHFVEVHLGERDEGRVDGDAGEEIRVQALARLRKLGRHGLVHGSRAEAL